MRSLMEVTQQVEDILNAAGLKPEGNEKFALIVTAIVNERPEAIALNYAEGGWTTNASEDGVQAGVVRADECPHCGCKEGNCCFCGEPIKARVVN